jgi:hypothetical protein
MSYIMIQNAGEIPLYGIRMLGLSTKKSDQIGKFGSGLKEAIALLLRKKCQLTICSGENVITFETKPFDGFDEICFIMSKDYGDYKAGEKYGLGMHINFGQHDWTDLYQALREIVCNAYDESKDLAYYDIRSDIEPKAGSTRVYINSTSGSGQMELIKEFGRLSEYIRFLDPNTKDIEKTDEGSIVATDRDLVVFNNGIMVQTKDVPHLWNYDLKDVKLNESRSADWNNIQYAASKVISKLSVENKVVFLDWITKSEAEKSFEYEIRYYFSKHASWHKAMSILYGSDYIVCNTDLHAFNKCTKAGRLPIVIKDYALMSMFKSMGIETYESLISVNVEDNMEDSNATVGQANKVWQGMIQLGIVPSWEAQPPVKAFKTINADHLGLYKNGTVFVNESIIGSEMEAMALIEEYSHHVTKAADETRAFQTFLVKSLATVMKNKIGV